MYPPDRRRAERCTAAPDADGGVKGVEVLGAELEQMQSTEVGFEVQPDDVPVQRHGLRLEGVLARAQPGR